MRHAGSKGAALEEVLTGLIHFDAVLRLNTEGYRGYSMR
jgi:hypothetical protein